MLFKILILSTSERYMSGFEFAGTYYYNGSNKKFYIHNGNGVFCYHNQHFTYVSSENFKHNIQNDTFVKDKSIVLSVDDINFDKLDSILNNCVENAIFSEI